MHPPKVESQSPSHHGAQPDSRHAQGGDAAFFSPAIRGLLVTGLWFACALACAALASWTGRQAPVAWGISGERTHLWGASIQAMVSLLGAGCVAVIAGFVVRWVRLGAGLVCLGLGLWARLTGPIDSGVYGIEQAMLTGQTQAFLRQSQATGLVACVGMVLWLLAVQSQARRHVQAGDPSAVSVGLGGAWVWSLAAACLTVLACFFCGRVGLVTTESGQVLGSLTAGYLFAGVTARLVFPKAGLAPMLLAPVGVAMVAGQVAWSSHASPEAFLAGYLAEDPTVRLATASALQTLTAGLLGLGMAIVLAGVVETAVPTDSKASA